MKLLLTPAVSTLGIIMWDKFVKQNRSPRFYVFYFFFIMAIMYCAHGFSKPSRLELPSPYPFPYEILQTVYENPEASLTQSQRDHIWKLLNHHCAMCLLCTNDARGILDRVKKKITASEFHTTDAALVGVATLCCSLNVTQAAIASTIVLVQENLRSVQKAMKEIITDMHKATYHAEMAEFYQELLWRDSLEDD